MKCVNVITAIAPARRKPARAYDIYFMYVLSAEYLWKSCRITGPAMQHRSGREKRAVDTPSICDQVLNIDYLPEIRRYFEGLSGSGAFSGGPACDFRSVRLFSFYVPYQP